MLIEPRRPFKPPRAVLPWRLRLPCVGIGVLSVGGLGHDLVAAALVAYLGNDASIVAAGGEHVSHLGVGEQMDLVRRSPRRHMILNRGHGENGHAYVG